MVEVNKGIQGSETAPGLRIGITGKMRSGKDEVADIITGRLGTDGEPYSKIGFAEGITELLNEYVPNVFEEGKPRKAYQDVGQVLRQFHENVWVDRAMERVNTVIRRAPETHIIIKDVRQPNEYYALKEAGFTIIRVEAETELRVARSLSSNDTFNVEHLYHETEHILDDFEVDFTITNNSTLEELTHTTETLLQELLEGE